MAYIVKSYQHRPCYRRGDLEAETVMLNAETFKTRKEAKEYIESKLRGKSAKRDYHRGTKQSTCYYYTNKTWIHENSGEEHTECFTFTLDKI